MPTNARLPIVFEDDDNWGQILNDFLLVAHNEDGSLRSNVFGGFGPSRVPFANGSGILVDEAGFEFNQATDTLSVANILASIVGATTVNATTVNATTLSAAALALSILTTKGDLIVGSGSGATARFAAGADNKYLRARAAATNGVEYEDVDRVKESGGQVLTLGAIADGNHLIRSGTTVIGGTSRSTVQIFSSSGTWTKPAGLTGIKVTVTGGGAGGSGAGGTTYNTGAGGTAGGTAIKWIAAGSLGSTETVTIGAGGSGGVFGGASPGSGGTSSFGSHCSATGGAPFGGSEGAGASGNINISGGRGLQGKTGTVGDFLDGGGGGNGMWGGGGQGAYPTSSGTSGAAPGAGGGTAAGTSGNGGAGANGVIIVEEYYA